MPQKLDLVPIVHEKKLDLQPLNLEPIEEDPVIAAKKTLARAPESFVNSVDKNIKPIARDEASGDILEPTDFWGGFRKSIKDQILGNTVDNPALREVARPRSLTDIGNLLLPSGIEGAIGAGKDLIGKKGNLGSIAEAAKSTENVQLPKNVEDLHVKSPLPEITKPILDVKGREIAPSQELSEHGPYPNYPNKTDDIFKRMGMGITPPESSKLPIRIQNGKQYLKEINKENVDKIYNAGYELKDDGQIIKSIKEDKPLTPPVVDSAVPSFGNRSKKPLDLKPVEPPTIDIKNKPTPFDEEELNTLMEDSLTRELTLNQKNRVRELQSKLFGDTGVDPFDEVDNPLSDKSSFGVPEVPINKQPTREPVKIPEKYDEFGNRIDEKYLDASSPEVPIKKNLLPGIDDITEMGGGLSPQISKENLDKVVPGKNTLDRVLNIGGTMKSLMSGPDLSGMRQGFPLIGTPEYWKSVKPMVQGALSEGKYNAIQNNIKMRPNAQPSIMIGKNMVSRYKAAGIKFTDLGKALSGREEQIMSHVPEDMRNAFTGYKAGAPIRAVGNMYRGSNRGFTAYINELRSTRFDKLIDLAKKAGHDVDDPAFLKSVGDYINNATGRGSLGDFEGAAKALNTIAFSPRLAMSRIHFLNPVNYASANPVVRKEMWKSAASMTGFLLGAGELANINPSTKFELDPRSADFGKIRLGNTRIDLGGGFLPYIRLLAQLVKGEKKNTETGKITNLNSGKFGAPDKGTVLGNFARTKESPIASLAHDWITGKDFKGEPFQYDTAFASRLSPMIAQDIIDVARENPKLLPITIPLSTFGANIQSYDSSKKRKMK